MDRLTELQAFAAVIDRSGFTDAARELGISKSAVSKHVISLEARLGARLLNRTTRRVSPTALGLAYYTRICLVLADLSAADALVSGMRDHPAGGIRLGVTRDLLPCLWQDLLPDFIRGHPAVTLQVLPHAAGQDLTAGDFDLALCLGDVASGALSLQSLGDDRLCWVAAPDHIARHGMPMDLRGQRVIDYPLAPVQVEGALLRVSDAAQALEAAIAGVGLAQLPQAICAQAVRAGLLHKVLPDQPLAQIPVQLLMPITRLVRAEVSALVDMLQARFSVKTDPAAPLRHDGCADGLLRSD